MPILAIAAVLSALAVIAAYLTEWGPFSIYHPEDMPLDPLPAPEIEPSQPVAPANDNSPVPTVPESEDRQFPPMIVSWARAIGLGEGASLQSNNPGNLKYSTLTASWGGTKGRAATDGGYLCNFPDEKTGMDALCNFLVLGAEDQLLAFHKARTLTAFTKVYAGNPPEGYIDGIVSYLGVPGDTNIATFLA